MGNRDRATELRKARSTMFRQPRWFSEGLWILSITRTSTGLFCDSSLEPSCYRNAVTNDVAEESAASSCDHSRVKSQVLVSPVLSRTIRPNRLPRYRARGTCGSHGRIVPTRRMAQAASPKGSGLDFDGMLDSFGLLKLASNRAMSASALVFAFFANRGARTTFSCRDSGERAVNGQNARS